MSDIRARAEAAARMEALLATADTTSLLEQGRVTVDGRTFEPQEVVRHLAPLLTDERREKLDRTAGARARGVVTVIEGLANAGNVSAVMRTAEGLGFLEMHLIAGADYFKNSARTSQGAEKWLDVWRWPEATACARHLKDRGYRIVATHLDATAQPIDAFDFTGPTALVFGNEHGGVSDELLKLSDARCLLPIDGLVESYNVSVAAALGLYHARQDRLARQRHHADLSEDEQTALRAAYYLRSLRSAEAVLRRVAEEKGKDDAA